MDPHLVEPQWLADRLGDPGIVVVDCSWYVPEAGRSARDDHVVAHIPGARFIDLDAVSDPDSPYVNMLPAPERFAAEVGALGIGDDTLVVVYDAVYVSARLWWMFRLFGHDRVRILNGGWKRWQALGLPVESGEPAPAVPATFTASAPVSGVASAPVSGVASAPVSGVAGWREVLAALGDGSAQVVDARTRERFTAELPSGYPGVPAGHMPGAVNLPWGKMIPQSGDFTFVAPERAAELFREAGVDLDRPIIATCGSGVTAAILAFQLDRLGKSDWRLYDGSWHEWGQRPDLPKATG